MQNKSITNIMNNAVHSINELDKSKETSKEPIYNVKQLNCKNCGGTLTYDASKDVVKCPYCGSSAIVIESDNVRIEKYKTNAKKDISYKKIDSEKEISLKELEVKKEMHEYRALIIIFILILFAWSILLIYIK